VGWDGHANGSEGCDYARVVKRWRA
jgi:hypothetical protein